MTGLFTVGDLLTATTLNDATTNVIARARRITAKTGITTESSYLRLDDIPMTAGRIYEITTSNLTMDSDTVGDVGTARLRGVYSASTGTSATTASTQLGESREFQDNATFADLIPLTVYYYPATTGYLSILLTAFRASGAGSFQMFASSTDPIDLIVKHIQVDPGDTGVSL